MAISSLAFRTDLALLRLAGSTVEDRGPRTEDRGLRTVRRRTHASQSDLPLGNFDLLATPPSADEVAGVLARYDADLPNGDFRSFGVDDTTDQSTALAPTTAAGLRIDAVTVMTTVMTAMSVHAPARPTRCGTPVLNQRG